MRIKARGDRRLRTNTALCCLIVILLVTVADALGGLWPMERWLFDRRARYCQFFTPTPTDKIVHLDIDDKALDDIGRWPWPRETQASLLEAICDAGPKVVAIDVLYSEPQEPRWVPDGDSKFKPILDDSLLASAMQRLGNVVLAGSFALDTEPLTQLARIAQDMLTADMELEEAQLVEALRRQGFNSADLAKQVSADFLSWRKASVTTRISKELDAADAARRGLPSARELQKRLLHRNNEFSPVGRELERQYEKVMAIRELRRYEPAVPPGLPAPYHSDNVQIPVPTFARAARIMSFVDYPVFRDGVVRSVPLVQEYDGRLIPQMGLTMAALLMDADPLTFRYQSDSITIPGKGKNGSDIVIPVRTLQPEGGGRAIPMGFDVPWVGTADWKNTYPSQPHRSINIVYNIVHTREKIVQSNAALDQAIQFLLVMLDEGDTGHRLKDYLAKKFSEHDPLARLSSIDEPLNFFDTMIPPGTSPNEGEDLRQKKVIASVNALRQARKEHPLLAAQLKKEVENLHTIIGGRGVLIGWAAAAATDRKPTSIHPDAPGPVVHGIIANGVLTGKMWRKLPSWVTVLAILLAGLCVTAATTYLPPGRGLVMSVSFMGLFLLFDGIVLFDWHNTILDMAGPMVTIVTVWGSGTVTRLIMESIERTRITRRFGSYVDPELVDFVLTSNEDIFTGQEREMTVVFTDLMGFTSLSEMLGRDIVPLLNEFMGMATKVIKNRRGLVNKFLGDGVMFFFNAPRPNVDHAADAVAAVLDLHVALEDFNIQLVDRGLPTLALRAGVSTGEMIVGDAGSSERSDYTVLGDLVNLAARLESANKVTGTRNLMTARTVELAGSVFLFRPVAKVRVVGQTTDVMVFEALARTESANENHRLLAEYSRETVNAFVEGRVADCLEGIAKIEKTFGDDLLTALYREQCESFLNDPENTTFGGQIVLTSK